MIGCAAGSLSLPLPVHAGERPVIAVAEPEGFADLTGEREVIVDIYFGGLQLGQTTISAAPGWVTLRDPHGVVALIPHVADRPALGSALGADRLPANSQLACSPSADRALCGRLAPEIAGLIYDRDRFRLDIFLNPRLLVVPNVETKRYLPAPERHLSLINSVGVAASGQSGRAGEYYSIFDQLVVAAGEKRLIADLSHSTGQGFGAESLAFEWDRPGLRYSAGAMWATGGSLSDRRKLVGLGIESQIDTRRDREELLGSPIVVYLAQRARIDVLHNGRLLNSAIYEAGNRQVDTSNLPDGSYDIVLRIEEAGQAARQERRSFTKSRAVPSLGRSDLFAFGGFLVDRSHFGSVLPSRHAFAAAGIAHRLSEQWAVGGNVEVTGELATAEFAATFLTPRAQVRAAAIVGSDGSYGGAFQLASSSSTRLGYSLDMRKLERKDAAANAAAGPAVDDDPGPFDFLPPVGSYSQGSGSLSYGAANFRFLATASFRDDESDRLRYNVGPALEWDFFRKGPVTLTMRGEMAATERGKSGFAGISLRLLRHTASFSALAGFATSNVRDDDRGDGPVTAIAGSWSHEVGGGELSIGAGLDRQPNRSSGSLASEFRHPMGAVSADLVRSDGPAAASSQYSIGFQTTLAMSKGAVELVGKSGTTSVIVARMSGAREGDRFDVLVNDQVAGIVSGERELKINLPPYRSYDVRVRPSAGGLLAYDNSVRRVALYPGSVARLDWTSNPVVLKIGRLISPDGAPVAHASILGAGIWAQTDANGYFQIEAPENAVLTVTLGNGPAYSLVLPTSPKADGIVRIGSVTCCRPIDAKTGKLARGN